MFKEIQRLLFLPFLSSKAKRIGVEIVKIAKPYKKILDFGCGDMVLTKYISEHLPKNVIKGIDVIDTNLTNLKPILYEGDKLPFDDNEFDLSYVIFVLHHISEQKKFLKEIARVSRRLIIVEEVYDNSIEKYLTFIHDWIVNRIESLSVNIPFTFHSDKEWKVIFKDMGYRLISEKRVFQLPLFNLTKQKMYFLEKITKRKSSRNRSV